ncbi:hypothetical protein EG329_007807 [Mollisiaceae sp. DMI_Dod_QoI]|nr:hypothetical protein EG329_007807 [Helotiales sp. DMI_Dod_QoI]
MGEKGGGGADSGDGEALGLRGGVEVSNRTCRRVKATKASTTGQGRATRYRVQAKLSNPIEVMGDRIFVCCIALTGHQTPVPAFWFPVGTAHPGRHAAVLALVQYSVRKMKRKGASWVQESESRLFVWKGSRPARRRYETLILALRAGAGTIVSLTGRIVWYLNLRQIPYTQCIQPPTLPRPDLKSLGTSYRRIPLLSIGSSIYLDTRLILHVLSTLFPPSPSHPPLSSPQTQGLEKLFQIWSVDSGFKSAAALLPASLPLLKDEKFRKDREDFTGTKWSEGGVERGRREAVVEMRNAFEMLERDFLGDGRVWIAGEDEGPTLMDIEAVWLVHWLVGLPGALPAEVFSKTEFPMVFAWVERFDKATREAAKKLGKPKTVKGAEAREIMKKGGWMEEMEWVVQERDPSGLRKGMVVEVWPTDSGFNHKDRGVLVGLDWKEVVIESRMEDGNPVRIHAPRHGFRIREAKDGGAKL